MNRFRLLSFALALCMLLTACVADKPSSSQPIIVSSEVSAEPKVPENLFEVIAQAMADEKVDSILAEHSNVIIEEEETTLGLERMDQFHTNFTEKTSDDEIYIGRYGNPVSVIYWLKYTAGEPHYTLIISEGGKQVQELELTELAKTANEYVFVADPDFQKQSVEVGVRGQKGLSYNNRCAHTDMEDSIDSRLIQTVGSEAFEKWLEESESRIECKINIYTFLKDFKISYQALTETLGETANELYPMDEIVKQVYPERLQSEPEQTNQSTDAEKPKAQGAVVTVAGDNFLGSVESAIIDEINAERRSLGLGELKLDENLKAASRIRSRELCQNDVWGHVRPNGDKWITVIEKDVPVAYRSAGENLATVEFNDPSISPHTDAGWWFQEWKNSPPHYEAICMPEFTHIGAGVYYEERDDGSIVAYATTIFTNP